MKKSVADKWVKALRSGKYVQCKDVLNNNYGQYCVLGVLARINTKAKHLKYPIGNNLMETILGTIQDDYKNTTLSVLNDSGFSDSDGHFVNEPLTFDELADIIQVIYKEL